MSNEADGLGMEGEADKLYLLLGEADRETVTAKLKANHSQYRKKRLESSLENWETIFDILNDPALVAVIGKISNPTLTHMAGERFRAATNNLLQKISKHPHVLFVHESFYYNDQRALPNDGDDDVAEWYHYFGSVSDDTRAFINDAFERNNIDVRAYQTNVEFSVEASEFLDAQDKNLLFRMYVPHNRMWSDEAKRVISLFKDYLTRVCGITVKEDQFSTAVGVVYELSSRGDFNASQLPTKFADFTALIDASATDVTKATEMLVARSIPTGEAEQIVRRYAKEAKRLTLDIRQERERKLLDVRHRMESELSDTINTEAEWAAVNSLVEELIPSIHSISGTLGGPSLPGPGPQRPLHLTQQIIGTVNGVVAQTLTGNQHIGAGAEAILDIIQKYGAAKAASLTSDVHELEDSATAPEKKIAAKGRVMAFLGSVGDKIGDVAVGVAQAYIQSKLNLPS